MRILRFIGWLLLDLFFAWIAWNAIVVLLYLVGIPSSVPVLAATLLTVVPLVTALLQIRRYYHRRS